jgi:hypothetical protein
MGLYFLEQKDMARLGTAYYNTAPGEKQSGTIILTTSQNGTGVRYNGTDYIDTLQWIFREFQNSGKMNFPKTEVPSSTPRPLTRYIPPKDRHSFGQYV